MSLLPLPRRPAKWRPASSTHAGPRSCITEIIARLERQNPELLDMAAKCTADLKDPPKAMLGFGMFYRLLTPVHLGAGPLTPAAAARGRRDSCPPVERNRRKGACGLTLDAITGLEERNPELLQMAHNFASQLENYLRAMQGFSLLPYKSLVMQSAADRVRLHWHGGGPPSRYRRDPAPAHHARSRP
jgi:hypothetical protein